jgi:hypothetical protein
VSFGLSDEDWMSLLHSEPSRRWPWFSFETLGDMKIITWRNTIEHGAILLGASVVIHVCCQVAYAQFRAEQPDGVGKWVSAIFGNYSWVGIAVAVVLTAVLVVSQVGQLQAVYETTYNVSICLLVVWAGVALIAMGIPWISSFAFTAQIIDMRPDKSPQPTRNGAFPSSLRFAATSSSAVAVHVASRRWLRFLR